MKSYNCSENVYEATIKRIAYVFDHFDEVYVSFSGGKDSTIVLNLAIEEANRRKKKIHIYHLDYEAQYDQTTYFVQQTWKTIAKNHYIYHVCLPVKAQCACKMDEGYWVPWELSSSDLWVRQPPANAITHDNADSFLLAAGTISDYDFNGRIASFFGEKFKGKKVACLLGNRADESLNRFRSVIKNPVSVEGEMNYWMTTVNKSVVNCYPIYDWATEDVWACNAKKGYEYNPLYDLFYQAGLSIHQMRVASPFNDSAMDSLKLYKVINPTMWGKMVSRVNGVNFASIYGGTTAMGWKNIKLPKGHTWQSYLQFLLNTLDAKTKSHYIAKFETSINFWRSKGGVLDVETRQELTKSGVQFVEQDPSSYKTKCLFPEYLDDAEVKNFKLVPTYKRMCICILKNDWYCKYMGFAQTKKEVELRKEAIARYSTLF